MAILDFMPKFAPWYTKTLLKKEDEPATDPSTGFFGDVFNFIDDAFAWTPTPEPVEPDWGGASLGAGFGEQAPAYEPYIEPDYSGMGDPFGMTDPFTEEDWTSAPSTPSSFTGPILGGMFGSAAPYAPPPPPSGIGDAIGGSLGSGEGWGFDLIDEPTQSWRGYAPPPSNFSGGIAGGMFGAEPAPTSYPDISAQWQDTDWVAAPPRESFGDNFGMDFRDRLDASIGERDPWADVQNWEGMPEPSADTSEWGQLAGIPGNGIGSAIGGAFSDFGTSLGSQIQEPIQFAPREDLDSGWLGGSGGAELGAYAPSVDRTQLSDIGYFPVGWDQMSPKERGEYVYFSGLRGNDYLSESDYANMPVDLKQKIGYADSRTEGGINNVFGKTWDVIDTAFTQPLQLMGDLAYDPAKSALSQIDPLGVPGLISGNPASFIGAGRDLWQGRDELEAPLDETVANVQDSSNPFEFFDKQGEDFKDRPFYEQLLLGLITPGSGIYKNASFAPKGLRAFDSALDFAQGGALLDNLGTIPGATSAMRNVIVPGAAGGGLGAATEAIFDPTYQDQFGNEYDPGYLEMILGGTALGIGGNAAMRSGTVPFGAAIEDAGRRIPLSGVRWKATYLDDPTIPPVPGKPTYGLPNTKGAPKKMPVKLEWEDPIDQAFYQASSGGKAKTSDEIYRMLEDKGFERADIMEAGNLIRDYLARTTRGFTGGETIRVPKIVRQAVDVTDELSTVPPSIANPVDEIIESSTVPPIKKLTVAQQKLPFAEQRAILGDAPDANQPGYLTWINENNRINSMEAKTPEWREANRETITPSEDIRIGVNDSGDVLYERPSDGLRYRVRKDTGRVDTGGNLAPSSATDVTAPVTPPVTTGSSVVADGVVDIPTPKPVISRPVPADLSPAARNAVEQIDAKLDNLIGVDPDLRRAEFNSRQRQIAENAREAAKNNPNLSEAEKLNAGNAATSDLTIDDLVPIVDDPGSLRLSTEEMNEVAKVINGRKLDPQIKSAASRILRKWANGEKVYKSELDTLRTAITGTWNPKGPRTINSIVTPPVTVAADGAVDAIPPAAAVTPKAPKGIDPADIAPEVTPQPQIIRRQNAANRPPAVDPNDPLKGQVFKPSGVERTAFPQSEAAIQPSLDVGPVDPLKGKTPGSVPEPTAFPDTVERPVQRAVLESVPKKHEPRINEWVSEMRQKTARMSAKERDNFLDKQQVKLAKELRAGDEPAAGSIAATARDNVGKLVQEDREFANNAIRTAWVEDWRRRYVPVLDKIELDEAISKTARGRGRISNKMADALTEYSDRLLLGLKNNGLSEEEAMATVQDEMSRYLNNRGADLVLKGDPDGLLRSVYTAVHTGPFKPQTPAGILPVPKGTGDVPKALQITSDVAMEIKNSKFGLTDMAGIFANGALAVLRNPHSLSAYYLARLAEIAGAPVDVRKWLDFAENAGLLATKQTDQMDPGAGSVISRAGKMMGGGKLEPVGDVLKTIDKGPMAINKALETVQYDIVLNQALRKPAYAGTMAILESLSKIPVFGKYIDPYDPRTQEAVARIVNGTTSAARPARDNVRRSIEASGPTSARFTRAQLDVIGMTTRLFALKNVSLEERAVLGMMVLGTAGALGAAKLAVGEDLNLDWDDPDNFGRLRIPDGKGGNLLLNLQPNTQVMKALHQSADAISDYIEGETDPKAVQQKLSDAWVRLAMGRLGPTGTTGLNAVGVGFDPKTNTWNYPGIPGVFEGSGDGWGSTMGTGEKTLRLFPFLPVGAVDYTADKLSGEEAGALSRLINFFGAGSFEENEITTILREEYGVDNWEEFEALNPSDYINRRQKLFDTHDGLYENDSAVSGYQELKKESSEDFMHGAVGSTVKSWRDDQKKKAANIEGAWNEMDLETKERPEKDGSAQWLYDYNQTFARSKEDPENPLSDLDFELLGKEQAAFWEKHPDPEVRKQLLAYQIGKAPTKADKEWAKSMARLNGFDPETGERLTYPGTDKPLPNYFEMDRYVWREVPNDESKEFHALFDRWKLKQSARVRELGTDKLIELYIQTDPEAATRVNGKAWTPAAIKDVQYYDKPSKEDPIFSEYKQIMLPDLLWFKPEQYWDNIEAALEEKYGKD